MNAFFVGLAIAGVAFGLWKAVDAAITFYACLVKAQEEVE